MSSAALSRVDVGRSLFYLQDFILLVWLRSGQLVMGRQNASSVDDVLLAKTKELVCRALVQLNSRELAQGTHMLYSRETVARWETQPNSTGEEKLTESKQEWPVLYEHFVKHLDADDVLMENLVEVLVTETIRIGLQRSAQALEASAAKLDGGSDLSGHPRPPSRRREQARRRQLALSLAEVVQSNRTRITSLRNGQLPYDSDSEDNDDVSSVSSASDYIGDRGAPRARISSTLARAPPALFTNVSARPRGSMLDTSALRNRENENGNPNGRFSQLDTSALREVVHGSEGARMFDTAALREGAQVGGRVSMLDTSALRQGARESGRASMLDTAARRAPRPNQPDTSALRVREGSDRGGRVSQLDTSALRIRPEENTGRNLTGSSALGDDMPQRLEGLLPASEGRISALRSAHRRAVFPHRATARVMNSSGGSESPDSLVNRFLTQPFPSDARSSPESALPSLRATTAVSGVEATEELNSRVISYRDEPAIDQLDNFEEGVVERMSEGSIEWRNGEFQAFASSRRRNRRRRENNDESFSRSTLDEGSMTLQRALDTLSQVEETIRSVSREAQGVADITRGNATSQGGRLDTFQLRRPVARLPSRTMRGDNQ